MALVAGVDGCPAGWICIRKEIGSSELTAQLFVVAADLFDQRPEPAVIAVDVPIGLSSAQPRFCDVAARKVLSPLRHSSVFPAPIRPALNARTYESACRITEKLSGRGISRQAWGIQGKVRDIDEALRARPHLRERVREIHPEVSFWAWNRSYPMEHAKRADAGRSERLALIASVYGRGAFTQVRERYTRTLAGDDDILDAFAALWTAERIALGTASTLPDAPPVDAEGLRMEIVY
ncbi:MAG: DUF429 domain-containing protein [Thermoanaerobaculia bacterium]